MLKAEFLAEYMSDKREVVVDYGEHQDDVVAYGTYAVVDDAETT